MKTFLNYIGSKRKLFKKIERYLPDSINNYYEPFVGGGSMLFYLNNILDIKMNYINDIDNDLINVYKVIKNNVNELIEYLHELDKYKSKIKFALIVKAYNEKKNIKNNVLKAALFIYINKRSYNNNFQYRKGDIIKPYFSNSNCKNSIFDKTNILKVSEFFKSVNINNVDYKEFLNKNKPKKGDFVFIDPPYIVSNVKTYYKKSFTLEDMIDLRQVCDNLNKKKIKFMITFNNNDDIKKIFKKYSIYSFENSSIQSNYGNVKEKEIIIINY
jgi:DNA adenine methylase